MTDLKKRLLNLTPEQQELVRQKLSARRLENKQQTSRSQDVAIIGMSGRFPGAGNVTEFWHNLANGVESIQEVPPERWDINPYFDPQPGTPNKTYSKWGGFLADVDQFDPLFFNISPREAELMDPQQRLFLQEAWKALEDAGYAPKALSGRECGVFVGVWQGDYGLMAPELTAQGMNGNACSVLASRIAYFLDLAGPCVAVDTACSSSLTAVHLGCQSLLNGDCELVLAGGVHIMTTPRLFVSTGHMGILSPEGHCRTFDDAADGWVMSEGVGVVVLKPLAQAVEDGDHIYGVIKSSGINQNGKGNGLAAPKALAQAQLQQKVYQKAGIDPETIDYVEVQGVSDKLGDAIEFEALQDSFSAFTSRQNFCALGSLKPNIGHPLTASGIACLIKVLLAFKYRQLPPTLHLEKVNEDFDIEHSPFYINTELQDWPQPEGQPRRAAINGFGLSGTNCHLVLEEKDEGGRTLAAYPSDSAGVKAEGQDFHPSSLILPPYLFPLSARTEERLEKVVENLLAYLNDHPSVSLESVAYTLQVGRDAMAIRLALIVDDREELLQGLKAYLQAGDDKSQAARFFRGQTDQSKDEAKILAGGRAGRELIDRAIAEKDWEKLAFFWIQGVDIPWDRLYSSDRPRRVPLPTYPFAPERYWLANGEGDLTGTPRESRPRLEEIPFEMDPTRTRRENIEAYLGRLLSHLVKIPVIDIKLTTDLYDYGVDSLVGMQLRRRLEEAFAIKLSGREMVEYNTIRALAEYLDKKAAGFGQMQTLPTAAEIRLSDPADEMTSEKSGQAEMSWPDTDPAVKMLLSEGQQGLWLLQTLRPEMSAYNVPVALRIHRRPEPQLWRKACDLLRAQYPILGTVIHIDDGQPVQVIDRDQTLFFETEDIGHLQEDEVIPYLKARAEQPFALETGPLMRVWLLTRAETETILLLTIHHIVLDGTSLVRLIEMLLQTYRSLAEGQAPTLSAGQTTYYDFVTWEQELLAGEEGQQHLAYWQAQLAGDLPLLSLPLDRPRPPEQRFKGDVYQALLEPDLTGRVRELAQASRVNLATIFLGIFKILLYRYTGQPDILIGTPAAGRPQRRFEETIGYFINMAVIRSQIDGEESFAAYLQKLRLIVIDALDHGIYPFPRLVADLQVKRDMATSPLFQVAFAFQNFIQSSAFETACQDILPCDFIDEVHQTGEFDLELEIVEAENSYRLNMKYNPAIFHRSTIERLVQHYLNLVAEVVAAPDKAIAAYDLLSDQEKQTLLVDWNNTAANYPGETCVYELFEAAANENLDRTAVIFEDTELTYQELSDKSTQVALYLQAQGVQPNTLVGICTDRSPEMIVGILGILKAGGAYVPIEPDYPQARIAYMLADSGVKLLLTQAKFKDQLSSLVEAEACQMILLDQDWAEVVSREDSPESRAQADHLAYVMYTSGSTGKPKGVMIEHRALTNFLVSMTQTPGFQTGQRLLAVTTYCFDISILEMFVPLINGGEVVILSAETVRNGERLRQAINHYRPDMMQATPSTWLMLFESGWQNEEQPTILCGGEALSESLRQKFKATGSRVWNMFGPTETTIWSTVKRIGYDEPITIGTPIHNTQIYILDSRRRPVPIGITGDLYIAGDGLARGYLNRPELTQEKFVNNPFSPGTRMYKTGDLARWLPDGEIEFLGRIDHQVKIRGHRIELGEIETALMQVDDIHKAVVLDQTDKNGHKYLCAYYTADREKAGLELRDFLARFLPAYMLPAHFVRVEAIPLNSSGKIDRKALLSQEVSLSQPQVLAKPETELEQTIAAIWQDVLDLKAVDLDDKFFEVGGNSLLIVKVYAQIEKALGAALQGADFELTTLFKYPTIRELSYHLSTMMSQPPAWPSQEQLTAVNGGEPSGQPETTAQAQLATGPGQKIETHTNIDEQEIPEYYENSVAVVGMSCHFPDATDYREFWQNLKQGHESIHFFSDEELARLNLPDPIAQHPGYIGCKAGIEDADLFDAAFFQISRRNAALMDPQARLLLEHSWAALEDAGYTPQQIPDTGVFMSCSNNFPPDSSQTPDPATQYVGWMMRQAGTLPTTISYRLGFSGPSIFVHSNCSSSLTALHTACQNLLLDECKLALVGACSINAMSGYIYQPDLNFSSDGHCKAFDASADGMVMGEGVAVVLLKPMCDAVRDGDHIYALLRGVGVNNDSSSKVGYYAPGVQGQSSLIQKTLRATGVDPETIGYIEAHGTGTKLGDPIEMAALTEAYRPFTSKTQYCGLGSVKTNIGHLDTAAGLAGLIKAALCLYHRQIPPSLNFTQPNPKIDFEASPFYVVTDHSAWESNGHPRRAAVSSLGVGGTNAHAILEEYPPTLDTPSEGNFAATGPVIIPLSAKTPERLIAYGQKLLAFLRELEPGQLNLTEMAYTLQVGRVAMEHRLVFVANDMPDLIEKLEAFGAGEKEIAGCYRGQVETDKETWRAFTTDEDARELIEKWLAKGKVHKLAELWAKGLALNWTLLYGARKPRRLSLPTYPFAGERFETPEPAAGASRDGSNNPAATGPKSDSQPGNGTGPVNQTDAQPIVPSIVPEALPPASRPDAAGRRSQPEAKSSDHRGRLKEIIKAKLAEALFIEADEVNENKRFVDLGLDSILGVQFINALNSTLATNIQVTKIYEYSSVNDLADYLMPLVNAASVSSQAVADDLAPSGVLEGDAAEHQQQFEETGFYPVNRTGDLADPKGVFEVFHLNNVSNPCLRDHIIYGASVMPFDAYLEMIYGGVKRLFETSAVELSQVHIVNPLVAQAGETLSVQLNYRSTGQVVHFRASGSPSSADQNRKLNVKGDVQEIAARPVKNEAYRQYLNDYDHHFSPADLYHGQSSVGRPGPFYQTIVELKTKGDVAVSRLALSPPARQLQSQFLLHPALVNGLLVTALNFAWQVNQTDEGVFLPVLIDRVLIYGAITEETYLGMVVVRETKENWVKFDADLIDEADRVVLSFKGLQVKNIKEDEFKTGLALVESPQISPPTSSQGRAVNGILSSGQPSVAPHRGDPAPPPAEDKIAVIGMSGRFPGASNLAEFWKNLAGGVDSITEIPPSRWDFEPYYAPGEPQPNKTYHKWGGFLEDVDRFDPTFFNISPLEAEQMDPQQRVFLEACWAALEDAGYAPPILSNLKCGVFVGATMSDYSALLNRVGLDNTAQAFMGSSSAILTSRIAYLLNLTGPTMAIDTACSSSLVALHQACQSLRQGESDMALAGGVSLIFTPQYHIKGSHTRILSPTGRCRPFDQHADGVSWGEGVGVVVLKPYSAALRDKDPIYGLILASGINQDGRTNGITAPNGKSQRELELEVYEKARIDPATIGYVEAHGTGTKLGDPVEVNALTEAFRQYTAKTGYCALGSVKSNIGHTTMSAGVAGLIKVLLSLKHKQIPPSINFTTPNEHINFAASPFYVNTTLQDWQPIETAPRRATVSSFGFGGTNCHMILEEYVDQRSETKNLHPSSLILHPSSLSFHPYLFILSARSEERLRAYAQKMLEFVTETLAAPSNQSEPGGVSLQKEVVALLSEIIEVNPEDIEIEQPFEEYGLDPVQLSRLRENIAERYRCEVPVTIISGRSTVISIAGFVANHGNNLPDTDNQDHTGVSLAEIAYTLQVGREAMDSRLAVVAYTTADLRDKLSHYLAHRKEQAEVYQGRVRAAQNRQEPANAIHLAMQQGDLTALAQLWVEGVELDWSLLYGAEQPRRVNLPTYPFARERYWIPNNEQLAMNNEQRFASTFISHPLVQQNISDSKQQRFSSHFNGDEFFLKDHRVRGEKVLPGVAYLEMARAAGELAFGDKQVRYIRDIVWARPITVSKGPVETQISLLPETADEVVYQVSTFEDHERWVVCAQGKLGLVAASNSNVNTNGAEQVVDLAAIRQRCPNRKTGETCYRFFRQQGLDYGPGFQVITEVISNQNEALARLELPVSLAAEQQTYGLHPSLMDGALQSVVGLLDGDDAASNPLYLPFAAQEIEMLRPLPKNGYVYVQLLEVHQEITHLNFAILDEQGGVCLKIRDYAVKSIAPARPSPENQALHQSEPDFYYRPYWQRETLVVPPGGSARTDGDILLVVPGEVPDIGDRLAAHYPRQRVIRCVLGENNARLNETEWEINPADAGGLARSLTSLTKNLHALYFLGGLSAVELDPTDLAGLDRSQETGVMNLFRLLKILEAQGLLHQRFALKVITHQVHQIYAQEAVRPWSASLCGLTMSVAKEYPALDVSCIDLAFKTDHTGRAVLDEQDIEAIVAESGSQGQPVALRQGVRYVRRLAHLSLPPVEELPYRQGGVYLILGGAGGIGLETSIYLAQHVGARMVLVGRSALTPEKEAQLKCIRAAGGDYLYCQADGTDLSQMQQVIRQAKARFGSLNGVIHSAIVLKDATLSMMDEATFRAALAPKVKASVVLYEAVKDEALDFMLFFSSVQSFWGNAGQSNYSAGSTFKDAFALSLMQRSIFPVKIINWGYWGYVGVVASEAYRQRLSRQGVRPIQVEEGMAALSRILAGPIAQVATLKVEPQTLSEMGIEFERKVEVLEPAPVSVLDGMLEQMKLEAEGLLQVNGS